MKLKIKKALLKRKINETLTDGYYGRAVTNGKATFDELCQSAGKGMTLDPIEIEACAKAFCRDAAEQLALGKIVELGPLGRLYPSVTSKWSEDKDALELTDMRTRVNYRPGDTVAAAVRSAAIAWATEEEAKQPTTNEDAGDDTPPTGDLEG